MLCCVVLCCAEGESWAKKKLKADAELCSLSATIPTKSNSSELLLERAYLLLRSKHQSHTLTLIHNANEIQTLSSQTVFAEASRIRIRVRIRIKKERERGKNGELLRELCRPNFTQCFSLRLAHKYTHKAHEHWQLKKSPRNRWNIWNTRVTRASITPNRTSFRVRRKSWKFHSELKRIFLKNQFTTS